MENHDETNWGCQYHSAVSASGILYSRSSRPGPARETAKAGTTCEVRKAATDEACYATETGTTTKARTPNSTATASETPTAAT